jgi:hypothetical protein
MKKITLLATALVFFTMIQTAADAEKLRITANNANIRSRPELGAEIVLKAAKGDIFSVAGKEDKWYKVLLPAKTGSPASSGYLHSDLAEIIGPQGNAAPSVEKNRPDQPAKKNKTWLARIQADKKLFSGYFAKFGLMTSPKASFGDKWLLDFGKDWGIINPFMTVGFEVQPYFRSFSDSDFSDSTLGANFFINAKGGANIGRFVKKLNFLTPYVGFGLGGTFSFSSSKAGTEKINDTNLYFAWHLMFGSEVVLKKMSVILELQMVKVSVPKISPDAIQYFLMLGARF